MINLSNVEIVLLELIKEKDKISGYEIQNLIEDRGYSNWANVGKTSVYSGIKKLQNKKLINLKAEKNKIGKGPAPYRIKLTKLGKEVLCSEIERALLSQKDLPLYYIGIAGMFLLDKNKVLNIFEKRKIINYKNIERLNKIFVKQGGKSMPIHAQALFEHPVLLIESDIKFIDKLIKKIKL